MAIEFQCPHCDARIRVPDHTAGLRGTCPQCRAKLLVPQIEIPEVQAPDSIPAGASFPDPENGAGELASDSGPLNFGIATEPDFVETEKSDDLLARLSEEPISISRKLKRKHRAKRSKAALLLPLVAGGLLIGFLVWNSGKGEAPLSGMLTAVVVPGLELPPKTIPKDSVEPLPEGWSDVVKDLAKHPAHMKSSLMHVMLRGVQGAIEVTVLEGTDSHFVRLDPAQNAALLAYNHKQATDLDQLRRRDLTAGLKKFVTAWDGKIQHGDQLGDLTQYRNSVGLTALVGGLGHHVEAAAAKLKYLCVYEDAEGRMYFLIPESTKSFELQGKDADNHRFPGHYTVKIEEPDAASKKPAKSRNERHGMERKTAEPTEMDGESMEGEPMDGAESPPPKKPARKRRAKKIP